MSGLRPRAATTLVRPGRQARPLPTARRLTFGSPRNRDRRGHSTVDAVPESGPGVRAPSPDSNSAATPTSPTGRPCLKQRHAKRPLLSRTGEREKRTRERRERERELQGRQSRGGGRERGYFWAGGVGRRCRASKCEHHGPFHGWSAAILQSCLALSE